MSTEKTINVSSKSVGFCGIMFIVLFVLKVGIGNTSVIGWSWWWIAVPLWGPIAFVLGATTTIFLLVILGFSSMWCIQRCCKLFSRK